PRWHCRRSSGCAGTVPAPESRRVIRRAWIAVGDRVRLVTPRPRPRARVRPVMSASSLPPGDRRPRTTWRLRPVAHRRLDVVWVDREYAAVMWRHSDGPRPGQSGPRGSVIPGTPSGIVRNSMTLGVGPLDRGPVAPGGPSTAERRAPEA